MGRPSTLYWQGGRTLDVMGPRDRRWPTATRVALLFGLRSGVAVPVVRYHDEAYSLETAKQIIETKSVIIPEEPLIIPKQSQRSPQKNP